MIEGKYKCSLKKGVIVNEDLLHGLENLLKMYSGDILYSVELKDGNRLNFKLLSDLLSYGNHSKSKIKLLKIICDRDFEMVFMPRDENILNGVSPSILCSYRLNTKEDEESFLAKLKMTLNQASVPYSSISRIVLYIIGISITLLGFIYFASGDKNNRGFFLGIAVLILFIDRWESFFPQLVFLIGAEIEIYNRKKILRNKFLWGFILIVILGFTIGILYILNFKRLLAK